MSAKQSEDKRKGFLPSLYSQGQNKDPRVKIIAAPKIHKNNSPCQYPKVRERIKSQVSDQHSNSIYFRRREIKSRAQCTKEVHEEVILQSYQQQRTLSLKKQRQSQANFRRKVLQTDIMDISNEILKVNELVDRSNGRLLELIHLRRNKPLEFT